MMDGFDFGVVSAENVGRVPIDQRDYLLINDLRQRMLDEYLFDLEKVPASFDLPGNGVGSGSDWIWLSPGFAISIEQLCDDGLYDGRKDVFRDLFTLIEYNAFASYINDLLAMQQDLLTIMTDL